MNLKRTIYLVVLLLSIAARQSFSQSYTPISGVVNDYASVTSFLSAQDWNPDSVVLASASGFNVDDTVMVYCVKGATIGTQADSSYTPGNPGYPPGDDAQIPRNTGRYAFLIITEVIGNTVVLNASINPEILPMGPGEVAQFIRVRSYRYANVTAAGLSAPDWNPLTGTGGVVALFVHGVLRLDGNIDVTGAGFKGAMGSTDTEYTAGCSITDTLLYYEPFYLDDSLRAGLKGEGITDTMFLYTRGKASNINGGGGGNGLLAGGGGGSNYTAGVRGGSESTACTPGVSVTGGDGGFDLGRFSWYYVNSDPGAGNRIFFGGGGGSGTRIATATTTDGGDGGGIVVIIADTILGNGGQILADGDNVSGVAVSGAGAGGGGGGCIILDVAGYQGTLPLSARGGDGGNSTGPDTTGMGGAGGGGIYWLAGDPDPPGVSGNFSPGTNGLYSYDTIVYDPLGSSNPAFQLDDLVAPLRGFLFNPVPSEFTVCSNQYPDMIVASEPKGGTGVYTYQWIDSSKNQTYWDIAPGLSTLQNYTPPDSLIDTTYFRRVVTSGALAADTSFRIAVYVHPSITGNTIAANDTVCSGNVPELFVSSATIGGGPTGGTYNYKWQHLPDGAGSYTDLTAVTAEPTYQAGGLITSTDYRRIAYSGVCIDTSNVERVRVLETITGNDITPYDTICFNTVPDLVSGPVPSNGDQDDLRYQWLTSTDPGVMGSVLPGDTLISYQSPALSQTTYFRRVVLSGNDNACRDTSAYVEILNVPAITTNTIGASQTLCQEDQAGLLTGSSPGGGYLGQYSYTWISSTDQISWDTARLGGAYDVMTPYDPGVMSGDTTWYQRVVGSGGLELVCKDTSTFIVINVLPSITNNLLTPVDDTLCQQDMPKVINGSLPGGGATVAGNDPTRVYRWEVAQIEGQPGPGDWNHPPTGADLQDYTDPNQLALDVDRWYRRIVTSGPSGECISVSDTVHLVVHSEITANAIDTAQAICFDDATAPALRHTALTGGEDTITPVYTWRSWMEGETSADAVDIAGSDQQEYLSGPYTNPSTLVYYYDRVVDMGACRDISGSMKVTIMQLPGGQLTDADFDVCEKDSVLQLDLNLDALTPGHYVLPWEVYLENGVHMGIGPGSVDQDMDTMGIVLDTYGADHQSYAYEIESIRYYPEPGAYACISPASLLTGTPVLINVSDRPVPRILVAGTELDAYEVCNTTAALVMEPDNGTLSYWSDPAGSVSFSPGGGQDEYQVSIPNNHDDFGEYRIYARSEAGDCAGEDSIDLHFFEEPAPADAGEPDVNVFLTTQDTLMAAPATAGIGTWELVEGSGTLVDPNDPNTVVYGLSKGENTFRWTVENGVCESSDDFTIVRVNEVKRYNGFSPNGDMNNEYYIMQGLVYADEFSITILNSLGSSIRTIDQDNYQALLDQVDESMITGGLKEDEMVIWDGRADNGNLVASGTYYFVLTFRMYEREYETGNIVGPGTPEELKDYVVVARE